MDTVELDLDDNSAQQRCSEESLSPISPDISNVFSDPQIIPRLGHEYQVEIPPMITGTEHLQLLMSPFESEELLHTSHSFLLGLPIPIMLIHDEVIDIEGDSDETVTVSEPAKSRKGKKSHIHKRKNDSGLIVDQSDAGLDDEKGSNLANFGLANKTNLFRPCTRKSSHLVPGSSGGSWSDADQDSFLLGLYLFGKKFDQIRRLIENKRMGEILSFYYGRFYKSDEHRRWSECKKPRNRKCIYGRKIFNGWRQKELLARLLTNVPEESKTSLLEVSKSFAEGKTSLENYVFYLKTTVGLSALVEAVAVGKGKADLTDLASEPMIASEVFPDILPSGKACSSLTSSDIVRYLTGGFRMSKARCNDIFWEAVWPRLLARGWHSEQPKNQFSVTSKNHLVFLMPGIRKFSRRKLVKGDHYFDSVSDILSKVASEPKLLELDSEGVTASSCNEEDSWVVQGQSDQDDPSDHQRQCYLKPRVSTSSQTGMKFTIIDSSLAHGGKSSKIREMRYSPIDFKITSKLASKENERHFFEEPLKVNGNTMPSNGGSVTSTQQFTVVDTSLMHPGKSSTVRETKYLPGEFKLSSEMNSSSVESEASSSNGSSYVHESDSTNTALADDSASVHPISEDRKETADLQLGTYNSFNSYNHSKVNDNGGSNQKPDNSDTACKLMEIQQDEKISTSDDNKSKRIIKHHFHRRAKSDHSIDSVPFMKRQKLNPCAKTETFCVTEKLAAGKESEQAAPCCALESLDGNNIADHQVDHSSVKVLTTSSSPNGNSDALEMPPETSEKHQFNKPSIDLNVPEFPRDSGGTSGTELFKMEVKDSQFIDSSSSCRPSTTNNFDIESSRTSIDVSAAEQPPLMNSRRQSTRKRPLTAKVLEAFESGLLTMKRRQKNKPVQTREIPFSSPSRKARSRLRTKSSHGSAGIIDMKEGEDAALVGNKAVTKKPLEPIEVAH